MLHAAGSRAKVHGVLTRGSKGTCSCELTLTNILLGQICSKNQRGVTQYAKSTVTLGAGCGASGTCICFYIVARQACQGSVPQYVTRPEVAGLTMCADTISKSCEHGKVYHVRYLKRPAGVVKEHNCSLCVCR